MRIALGTASASAWASTWANAPAITAAILARAALETTVRAFASFALLALALPGSAAASDWDVPAAGSCSASRGVVELGAVADATPLPFQPGQIVTFEQLDILRDFIPSILWTYRERFFYEGMRLEIGPCFRDYSPPAFYQEASNELAGTTRLNERGGIEGYRAGMPFSPETIDPNDPNAGLRWAWNFQNRYQAAGFRGEFRITDLRGVVGRAEPFDGEIFKMLLARRADLTDYRTPYAGRRIWAAGGLFFRPFNSREFSWRQFRAEQQEQDPGHADELHAYVPTMRRVRRVSASHVEGLYLPTFAVGISQGTESLAGAEAGPATAGHAGTIYPKRSGFEGLDISPHRYGVTLLGLHDVLAPINTTNAVYPTDPDRDYGPWGLSFASDRWDLRRAIVLQLALRSRRHQDEKSRIVYHLDLQTLHPLYYVSYDRRGDVVDAGVFAGRFSEDRPDYPRWPDDLDRPVRVIDSVAAAFANIDLHGSWRRESDSMISLPPSENELRLLVSVSLLTRRH
jgi:hypothetical protein